MRTVAIVIGMSLVGIVSGCSTFRSSARNDSCSATAAQVSHATEYGRPRPILDGIGWVVGIPGKIVLWNRRVDNHNISSQTVTAVEEYLEGSGLTDVKIRVNQYDPVGEWERLKNNTDVAPGWRYTFGTVSWIGYTVFPGRVFGRDHYNPYTDTVSLYSDVSSIGIVEAAYGSDVHGQKYPGTYATFQQIPGVNMWHVSKNTTQAITYINQHGDIPQRREAYDVLYPRYGVAAGNAVSSYISLPFLELAGAVAGHAAGRYESSQIPDVNVALGQDE